jgi:putative redox protein
MAASQVTLAWTGEGLRFEADHPSHNVFRTDGDGKTAHSPVQILLLSLAACTGADVVDILKKMRVPLNALEVVVEAERNEEHPRYVKAAHMRFIVRGVAEANREKVERAVELSHEKYCSVAHSLRQDIAFSTETVLMDA